MYLIRKMTSAIKKNCTSPMNEVLPWPEHTKTVHFSEREFGISDDFWSSLVKEPRHSEKKIGSPRLLSLATRTRTNAPAGRAGIVTGPSPAAGRPHNLFYCPKPHGSGRVIGGFQNLTDGVRSPSPHPTRPDPT